MDRFGAMRRLLSPQTAAFIGGDGAAAVIVTYGNGVRLSLQAVAAAGEGWSTSPRLSPSLFPLRVLLLSKSLGSAVWAASSCIAASEGSSGSSHSQITATFKGSVPPVAVTVAVSSIN